MTFDNQKVFPKERLEAARKAAEERLAHTDGKLDGEKLKLPEVAVPLAMLGLDWEGPTPEILEIRLLPSPCDRKKGFATQRPATRRR